MHVPGYQIDGPIGFGADGATWLARDAHGTAVAVRALAPVAAERDRARTERLRQLAAIDHPHLVRLREVVATDSGHLAVITRAVPGPTLATLRVGRGGLGVAEAIGVGVQLASALVAVHEAGLTHGDLAPANVVLTPGQGAIVVDLAGEPAWEAGTGGFAAPELDRGAVASPASDVYALARLIVWLVADSERAGLQQVLRPALESEPQQRCSAAQVLSILSAHPQAEVGVPDLHALAGVSLRAHAQRDLTRRKGTHRPRHRRAPDRKPLLVAAVVLVAALAGAVTWVWPGLITWGQTDAGTDRGVAEGQGGPVEAVHELTRARDQALNDADARALGNLTVPGSPASAQDQRLAADLTSGALQVDGAHTDVVEAEVLIGRHDAASRSGAAGSAGPDGEMPDGEAPDGEAPDGEAAGGEAADGEARAWVRTVLHAHEHTRTTDEGVETVPAERTCVLLGLQLHQGWLVEQVRAG